MSVPEHLHGRALGPLWQAVHDRLSSGQLVRSVTLRGLDEPEQEAMADLLGLAYDPGPRLSVRLDRLDETLAPYGLDTRAAVTKIVGPIGNRAADRARNVGERERLWSWLSTHPVVAAEPALLRWAEQVRADGVPGGETEVLRARLATALEVVAALPLADRRPLPAFAAEHTGDPHALDGSGGLPGLVLRALAALRDGPAPEGAEARRALWGAFGVDCDAHSTSVLTLGLRPEGAGPLAATLRMWARAGRAAVVTLDQLSHCPDLAQSAPVVHVVENPSVLALAQRQLGSDCPPLVCVSGWPNSAAVTLLRRLASSGAGLRYHGDFDGEGLRIAAHVMARTGARPWRMDTGDYLAGLGGGPGAPPPGRLTPTPWDADLASAIAEHGAAVPEERVARVLLDDLREAAAYRA